MHGHIETLLLTDINAKSNMKTQLLPPACCHGHTEIAKAPWRGELMLMQKKCVWHDSSHYASRKGVTLRPPWPSRNKWADMNAKGGHTPQHSSNGHIETTMALMWGRHESQKRDQVPFLHHASIMVALRSPWPSWRGRLINAKAL
jgi:hypothetical protein